MPKVVKVKKSRKDQGSCSRCSVPIKRGDSYVWWKFNFGATRKRCSDPACYPKASDLTTSEFLSQIYDFQDQASKCDNGKELKDLAAEVRELGSEQEEKLSNLPDSLQYAPTGELLQERADACEEWADELESHTSDFEEVQELLDGVATEKDDQAAQDAVENWRSMIPEYPG